MASRREFVHIALGTNLGNRSLNLEQAIGFLGTIMEIQARSSVYETPPWGVEDQPRFYNQVVNGYTAFSPLRLLDALKSIEHEMGRQKTVRYGPRVIDLDILLYGERIIHYHRLTVPHPRMMERAFVLLPLAEISPNLILPATTQTVWQALQHVDCTGIVIPQINPLDPR